MNKILLGFVLIGQIQLKHKLDYEVDHKFDLIVTASDSDPNIQKTSTATVSIQVLDVNDNQPEFDPHKSIFYVPENSPNGTSVARVTAKDEDTNAFGQVWYKMEVADDDGKLTMNKDTVSVIIKTNRTYYQGWLSVFII